MRQSEEILLHLNFAAPAFTLSNKNKNNNKTKDEPVKPLVTLAFDGRVFCYVVVTCSFLDKVNAGAAKFKCSNIPSDCFIFSFY